MNNLLLMPANKTAHCKADCVQFVLIKSVCVQIKCVVSASFTLMLRYSRVPSIALTNVSPLLYSALAGLKRPIKNASETNESCTHF